MDFKAADKAVRKINRLREGRDEAERKAVAKIDKRIDDKTVEILNELDVDTRAAERAAVGLR